MNSSLGQSKAQPFRALEFGDAHLDSFEEAVTYAVELGGDTNTIGAMTGAIGGAFHGIEVIPRSGIASWRTKL